jgi:hypothetical protein
MTNLEVRMTNTYRIDSQAITIIYKKILILFSKTPQKYKIKENNIS